MPIKSADITKMWFGICIDCKEETYIRLKKRVCYACRYKKAIKDNKIPSAEQRKIYRAAYYKKNLLFSKYKSYRHQDKIKNRKTIEWDEFNALIKQNPKCYFCTNSTLEFLGLDRVNNDLGHDITNVVLCCEKCNFLLGDLPWEAKLELKRGLASINEKGILNQWMIPTKRNTTRRGAVLAT